MNKILIVGNLPNTHLIRLVESSSVFEDTKYQIDGFSFNISTDINYLKTIGYTNICVCKKYFPEFVYKLKKIRMFFSIIDFIVSFLQVKHHYDLINIHFLTIESFFLFPFYKFKSKKIMISPWGSDVYRIPRWYVPFFKCLYKWADYISVPPIKFRLDIIKKFNITNENKIINLGFGSKQIDLISSSDRTKDQAKSIIGLKDDIVITCGYNANINQQHYKIIDAIYTIKDKLPGNITFLFPMTYNEYPSGYVFDVNNKLNEYNIKHILYTKFLSDEDLLLIQQSTDIFIHIQKTDAFSASVQENILCGNFVINGEWVRYPDLELYGIPYALVSDTNEIGDIILSYIYRNLSPDIHKNLIRDIQNNGWKEKGKQWNIFYSNITINNAIKR